MPQERGSGLVVSSAPLVGRGADLRAIDELLASGERLVTITGPGGVGKTRLALEVARGHLEGLNPDVGFGVWICDLTEAETLEALCDALAEVLGVAAMSGSGGLVDHLGQVLAARDAALLVLDNFDRVTAHAHASLGRWMALAPRLRIVVTSRERMHLSGEVVHELSPLSLPAPNQPVTDSEAVELFVSSARRVRRGWEIKGGEASFVAEIAAELDGLPLAIELAASRMAVMGPRALLHRLRSGFEVLRRTQRGGASRHATLDDTIDWSWQLLSPWEQDALAQCSTFRGGFSLEAAESVVSVEHHHGAEPIVDVIQSLRAKSLLRVFEPPALSDEVRLGMYAAVREFADGKLADSGSVSDVEARHAQYFVEAGRRWSHEARLARGVTSRHRLLLDRENLLAVAERVLQRGPVTVSTAQPALEVLVILAPVLLVHGPLQRYAELLEPVLDATAGSGADPSLMAHAMATRGRLLCHLGQRREGVSDLVQALNVGLKLDAKSLSAQIQLWLSEALLETADRDKAIAWASDAAKVFHEISDAEGEALAQGVLGQLEARQGRLDQARHCYQTALSALTIPSTSAEAVIRRLLGELHLAEGHSDRALSYLESSAALCRELGDRHGEGIALGKMALVEHDAGHSERAQQQYEIVIDLMGDQGFRRLRGVFMGFLGLLCQERGHLEASEKHLVDACDVLADGGDDVHLGLFLAHRGGVHSELGRLEEARVAFAAAEDRLGNGPLRHVVELQKALLDPSRAREIMESARESSGTSVEVRLAYSCVEAALSRGTSSPLSQEDRETLVVEPTGRWFRPPHAEPVDLERRRPLRLIVARLAERRLDAPGMPTPWEGLLEAGWPGERVIPSAGAHRVRVAVSTLRKLGLRSVLLTVDEGYLFDPSIETRVDDTVETARTTTNRS